MGTTKYNETEKLLIYVPRDNPSDVELSSDSQSVGPLYCLWVLCTSLLHYEINRRLLTIGKGIDF